MLNRCVWLLLWISWIIPGIALGSGVSKVATHRLSQSPYSVLRGVVELPSEGVWHSPSTPEQSVAQLYLIPPERGQEQLGRRVGKAVRQQRIDRGRWMVRLVYSASLDYAKGHQGIGPASIADLDGEQRQWMVRRLQTSPWPDVDSASGEPTAGPFVFLAPRARFHFNDEGNWGVEPSRREVLAVELRPYVDDGEHWVLFTDGTCLRQPIDASFVEQHNLTILPVVEEPRQAGPDLRATMPYPLVGLREASATGAFEVTVHNTISDEVLTVAWDVGEPKADPEVKETLQEGRRVAWQPYLQTGPSPVLRSWLSTTNNAGNAQPGENLTVFSLLGGRAAVEETLQLQDLNVGRSDRGGNVKVASLSGVEVKAHPFAEMLGDQSGRRLALADGAPPDRFFVYLAEPNAILPFLDKGAGFLSIVGTGLSGNRLDYDLTSRYLGLLGITRPWLEAVLKAGLVKNMAIMLPDLFLIDGTDITVTAKLDRPEMFDRLLRVAGVFGLRAGDVQTVWAPGGEKAYWALRQDILCISTHREEIDRVLELINAGGDGSLGQSAEFRYMLTQLPVDPDTRFYAYFSDPFVRRLVGPQVKLAQRRRIQARAQMEAITARVLLARLDGVEAVESVDQLVQLEYLPDSFRGGEFSIQDGGVVRSEVYGELPRMKSLLEVPVEEVTEAEAEAYRRYMENYSRYWRQFFDPIAIRLNDAPDGSLELTTFILPLVDSSIYNRLRELIVRHEDNIPLAVPRVRPSPVLQFSLNLREQAWQRIAGDFSGWFLRFGGANPALLDDLGPALHLAVFDADPVIALGSGDMMGAFGGNVIRFGRNDMAMIPVVLSLLIRPCTIRVETRDAERTSRFLREAASGWTGRQRNDRWMQTSFYQEGNRDSWVWTMAVEGLMKLRVGVEVTDRYLVIRNIPWSTKDTIVGIRDTSLNGAGLSVWPAAGKLQLPGLFASAADQERQATMASLGRLYPLVISGVADAESAGELHRQLFGFRPLHPADGEWLWEDGHLSSSVYGAAWRQRQPAFDPNRSFGLLSSIQDVHLTMQFEDAGLRSQIRWRLRSGE